MLPSDPKMYGKIKPNIRCCIYHALVCNAKANNKYMGTLSDPNMESSYTQYIDANNHYGWAMSQACQNS